MVSNEMLSGDSFARIALTLFAVIQGAAMIFFDFDRTHATNPSWTGHARFHLVWQDLNLVLLALVEVALIAMSHRYGPGAFFCAWVLAAIPSVGFVLAQATRSRFRGALSDPNGIPPKRVNLGTKRITIDGNAAMVYVAFVVLAIIAGMYSSSSH